MTITYCFLRSKPRISFELHVNAWRCWLRKLLQRAPHFPTSLPTSWGQSLLVHLWVMMWWLMILAMLVIVDVQRWCWRWGQTTRTGHVILRRKIRKIAVKYWILYIQFVSCTGTGEKGWINTTMTMRQCKTMIIFIQVAWCWNLWHKPCSACVGLKLSWLFTHPMYMK
jgi:hypothetical protein